MQYTLTSSSNCVNLNLRPRCHQEHEKKGGGGGGGGYILRSARKKMWVPGVGVSVGFEERSASRLHVRKKGVL